MAVINTNLLSLNGQSHLKHSQSAMEAAIERLSSGLRINGAKYDAAGQVIANRMDPTFKRESPSPRDQRWFLANANCRRGGTGP
jgi:flagellin